MSDETVYGVIGLLFLFVLAIVAIIAYFVMAGILWRLGRKFRDESFLAYCIPIYQWVLICRCANVSAWHTALLFVPILNSGAAVWIFGNVARRLGRSFWGYGIGVLFFIPLLILAFGNDKPVVESTPQVEYLQPPVSRRYLLSCVHGEVIGSRYEITAGSVVIGRSPAQAQVVLNHPHVSATHARVWMDAVSGGSHVWVEDLDSRNGTSFRKGIKDGWTVLKGAAILLNEGDMIRIADGVAEFRLIGG